MRHPPLPLLPLLLLTLLVGAPARADEVVLKGGSTLAGVVLKQDDAGVRLLQPGGDEVRIALADLKEVRVAADAPQGEKVIRYASDPKAGTEGLQVAVLHLLHPGTGRRVDLVGAVHIADVAYFREVQRLLEQVDVVLYEMVKPKDAKPGDKPPPGKEGELGVRELQQKMAEWFGLKFQLDQISYDRPHFVHADLTLEEFTGAPGAQPLGEQMDGQMKMLGGLLKMMDGVMKGPGMQKTVKGALGRFMANLTPKQLGMFMGASTVELLIDRRNETCVRCLLDLPPEAKTVAIFYGAAHLPDLEQRLKAQGYERAGARWLTAWDLRAKEPKKEAPKEPPVEAPAAR